MTHHLKKKLILAGSKLTEDKRIAKKLKTDAEEDSRLRRIAAVAARQRVVPIADSSRATFHSHANSAAPLPRARKVAKTEASCARARCTTRPSSSPPSMTPTATRCPPPHPVRLLHRTLGRGR